MTFKHQKKLVFCMEEVLMKKIVVILLKVSLLMESLLDEQH